MICVLDASAAVDIFLLQNEASLFAEKVARARKVIAPDFFKVEVSNVMAKHVRGGLAGQDLANSVRKKAIDLVGTFVSVDENYDEAYLEAIRLKHSVYDMLYFTLARRNGAVLLTSDAKLKKLAEHNGVRVG